MYKGSVAFSAGCGSGYRDGVRSLDVMVESLSGGSRPEIQEEGKVMELLVPLYYTDSVKLYLCDCCCD